MAVINVLTTPAIKLSSKYYVFRHLFSQQGFPDSCLTGGYSVPPGVQDFPRNYTQGCHCDELPVCAEPALDGAAVCVVLALGEALAHAATGHGHEAFAQVAA